MLLDAPHLAAMVAKVQRMPYAWPGPPTAASAKETGRGTCASKHALLRDDIRAVGLGCERLIVVGPLVPDVWPDLGEGGLHLMEVHECLTVVTPWAGPLLVDVTWHPAAVRAGLPGTLNWDGASDMICAIAATRAYVVTSDFRAQKEMLRSRLYSAADRNTRDQILATIAKRADELP